MRYHAAMPRKRAFLAAVTAVALSTGLVVAHEPPSDAQSGLDTARDASGRDVPTATESGGFLTGFGSGHGEEVSEAAHGETPEGWETHGAWVSSIATGWGQQVSSEASDGASDAADAAAEGLSHRP